jgi:hypothetical protein
MKPNRTAVENRDLPPKVAERAAAETESPLRHASWMQRLVGRAKPRHDVRTVAERVDGEARRLGRQVRRFGRRLTA